MCKKCLYRQICKKCLHRQLCQKFIYIHICSLQIMFLWVDVQEMSLQANVEQMSPQPDVQEMSICKCARSLPSCRCARNFSIGRWDEMSPYADVYKESNCNVQIMYLQADLTLRRSPIPQACPPERISYVRKNNPIKWGLLDISTYVSIDL